MNSPHLPRLPSRSPYTIREKLRMALWWSVEAILFRPSPHILNRWRCFLLRTFGARIGVNTFVHSRAKIWFPWNLSIGSHAGIGFDALIYNLASVEIGDYATISQRVHVNTGSHDYTDPAFPLITKSVFIGRGVFVGADSYIGWGLQISDMAVIGARSVVVSDLPGYTVSVGHPCKPVRSFTMKSVP